VASKLRLRDWDVLLQRAAAMEGVDAKIRADLDKHVPPIAARIWTESSVLRYAETRMDRAALTGTRVRSSARSTTLTAAAAPRIDVPYWAVEFGDRNKTKVTYSRRSPRGRRHSVTRNTQAQLPERKSRGRVVYRYGVEAMRRLMSAYAQTLARTLHQTLEGK
jgi:hypothetical protein